MRPPPHGTSSTEPRDTGKGPRDQLHFSQMLAARAMLVFGGCILGVFGPSGIRGNGGKRVQRPAAVAGMVRRSRTFVPGFASFSAVARACFRATINFCEVPIHPTRTTRSTVNPADSSSWLNRAGRLALAIGPPLLHSLEQRAQKSEPPIIEKRNDEMMGGDALELTQNAEPVTGGFRAAAGCRTPRQRHWQRNPVALRLPEQTLPPRQHGASLPGQGQHRIRNVGLDHQPVRGGETFEEAACATGRSRTVSHLPRLFRILRTAAASRS